MKAICLIVTLVGFAAVCSAQPQLLYYKFNEGTGDTVANDAPGSPAPSSATFTATPNWNTSTPQLGAAAVSVKSENLVTKLDPAAAGITDWTLEFWINQATPTPGDIFTDNNSSLVLTVDDGTIYSSKGTIFVYSATYGVKFATSVVVADGTWHHFALTYEAASTTWQLYVDGTADKSTTGSFTFTGAGVDIGNGGAYGQLQADLDEYRFWNVLRKQSEIQADMNKELGAAGDPEIDVNSGGTPYADGSTQNIGTLTAGVQSSDTLTIDNLGTTNNLNITSISINPTGVSNCSVSVSALTPSSPIGPGGSATFDSFVTPTANGAFEFTIVIRNDDADEPNYTVIFQGTAVGPEINVFRGAAIADGGTDTVAGTIQATLVTLTYTIQNAGNANLTFGATPVTVSNRVNCTAVVSGGQPSSTLAPSTTVNVNIDVTPTAVGAWSFDIDIASDDLNEGNYDIAVNGTATAAPAPEMDVFDPAPAAVPDGGTATLNGTVVAVAFPSTFEIRNTGGAVLNLTGATRVVVVSGTNCNASCTAQPAATVAVGVPATFDLSVTPTAVGSWNFTVSIDNNDSNENPYNFTVSGTAAASPTPEMDVFDPAAAALADGGTATLNGTVAAVAFPATFEIRNTGSAVLNLTGATRVVVVAGTNCNASCTLQPAATVAVGVPATFNLSVTPAAMGAWDFTVSIDNDDSNEDPYNFTVTGTATATPAPEIDVQFAAASIADGGTEAVNNTGVAAFTRTYTIVNTGSLVLNLNGLPDRVTVGPQTNCLVTVTLQPAATVGAAGGTSAFDVQIDPTSTGLFSFTLSVANDDASENPYNWTFSGNTAAAGGLGGGGGGGGGGCSAVSGNYGWLALLGLLSTLAVATRVRRGRAA